MFTLKRCCAVPPALSVACTVKAKLPAAVGVPETVPATLSSESPAGSAPDATDHAIGGLPPADWMVWLYAVPTAPAGSAAVTMVNGCGFTTRVKAAWAVAPVVSAT